MKIGHFTPAYRGDIKIGVAYGLVHDVIWAKDRGHDIRPFFADVSNIARARNFAINNALAHETDLLLMQDADCYMPGGALGRLYETLREHDAAAVGALIRCRNKAAMNAEPAKPGEVYEGEVGTGIMLIDLREVCKVGLPWFHVETTPDGVTQVCGEDIYFCRKLKAAGLRVMIDARFPTLHESDEALAYDPGGLRG